MTAFAMSVSYEVVLMKNLDACIDEEVASSFTTIGAPCNANFSKVEGCATKA